MNWLKIIILFFGAGFAGSYASLVGGGGLVSFPLLILIGLPTNVALGTQRLAAVFLELGSVLKFHSLKKINFKLAIALGIVSAIGALIGVNIVVHINTKVLNTIVSFILVFSSLIVFNKDRLGIKEHKASKKQLFFLFLSMLPLGMYTGFSGAGFGTFIVIFLLLFGLNFLESAANSRVIGFCTSLVGSIAFAHFGLINYVYGISLGLGFAVGSWIGIDISLKKKENYIHIILYFVIALTIAKLILNSLGYKFI